MVVGAFPVVKLGALVLKQVSKPLANIVKQRAKNSPFFRTYICMPPAQFYHWAEVKMKMWSMNLGKPVNIPKLNEALAIELGAELLGEGIMFVIAAGILIAEYVRSTRKEEKKEEERLAELTRIQGDLKELYLSTAQQDAQIRELVRILQVKMPEVSYTPKSYNESLIPHHHREDYKEKDDQVSMFSTVKGWIWKSIDLIIEDSSAESQAEHAPVVVKIIPSSSQPNNNTSSSPSSDPCPLCPPEGVTPTATPPPKVPTDSKKS